MTNKKITEENKKEYEKYLAEAQPCIKELKEYVKDDENNLNFSSSSLRFLDEFINDVKYEGKIKFYKTDDKYTNEEKWLVVRISYYLGEVLVKNLKFRWNLDKTVNSFSFGRAVLTRDDYYLKIEPLNLVMNLWKQDASIFEWYKNTSDKIIKTSKSK